MGGGLGPPGWHRVLTDLLSAIDHLLPDEAARRFQVVQIKEKVGELRIRAISRGTWDSRSMPLWTATQSGNYPRIPEDRHADRLLASFWPEIERLVELSRERSLATCSRCGRPGTLQHVEGVAVLCAEHFDEAMRKRLGPAEKSATD
jgi:hypothetical protein